MTTSTPRTSVRPTKPSSRLVRALIAAELRVFLRQPVMLALTLLLPAGLLVITAIAETGGSPAVWAQIAGRNMVAAQCITVYFVALNTVTARRHTLALKRLRTTALPGSGIVAGLLTPPLLVGAFQVVVILAGLVLLGSPPPQQPLLVALSAALGMVIAALAGVVTSAFTATPEKAQWTMLPLFVAAMGSVAVLPSLGDGVGSATLRLVPMVANAHLTSTGWWSAGPDAVQVILDLAIMVVWIGVLGVLSVRTFRWERRR